MGYARPIREQRGVALAIVMVILLFVTGLGIASVRTVTLQERMTANTVDRTVALQSANRVIGTVQDILMDQVPNNPGFKATSTGLADCDPSITTSDDSSRCTANGLCLAPGPQCTPRWEDSTFNLWATTEPSTLATDPNLAAGTNDAALAKGLTQQYFVEYLGSNFKCYADTAKGNCLLYRVTVRTNTGAERAVVQLQSNIIFEHIAGGWTSYAISRHEIVN